MKDGSGGMRFGLAKALGAISHWGLASVLSRPAANFPGKIGLYADPGLIGHLSPRLAKGSICVVGTNGKTTVSNLLADALEVSGRRVCCNRTGANLDSGVASALLSAKGADWGVFECDELWLGKVTPGLRPRYVVLLNLFRDQLDRCGEIDHVQRRIASALEASPETVLIYNGDDPLCQAIAQSVSNECIAFGIDQDLHLPQNRVADGQMCQQCNTMLEYDYRQYGQLGAFRCPRCGFARPCLDVRVTEVSFSDSSLSACLQADGMFGRMEGGGSFERMELTASYGGHYMVYNVAAAALAARLAGCGEAGIHTAIRGFDPHNGRLQRFDVAGRPALLNLAKNPAGFNQCIRLVAAAVQPSSGGESAPCQGLCQDPCQGPCDVAFFVNDKEADGHDVSWFWDVDFEELASAVSSGGLRVFVGGLRAHDLQVRLKYAGIAATVVDGVSQMLSTGDASSGGRAFVIANYTALPGVKGDLERIQEQGRVASEAAPRDADAPAAAGATKLLHPESVADYGGGAAGCVVDGPHESGDRVPVRIVHMLPDLLNLYGDGGNVTVLAKRLEWRGIPVEVFRARHGDRIDFSSADLVVMGGSPDREQKLASADLVNLKEDLAKYVKDGGPLLAICGSYQILGDTWLVDDEEVPGLGLIDIRTGRGKGSTDRLIGNIALSSPLAEKPVIGFENHAGRTILGDGVEPFGRVVSSTGKGNDDSGGADGVIYENVLGTYLHGPLLAKNPEIADWLLERAIWRWIRRADSAALPQEDGGAFSEQDVSWLPLAELDDSEELAANELMAHRLNAR